VPFVQGHLTGSAATASISSACACCDRPLELTVTNDLRYEVLSDDAEPVISVPSVDVPSLKDPSIIHAF
jgi:hypothetical protein